MTEVGRRSDVASSSERGMFDPWPSEVEVHVEWGVPAALLAARRGDLVVVVDVLSFSTAAVEVAEQGGVIFCYAPEDLDRLGGREAAAEQHDAAVLSKNRQVAPGEFSLSPASLQSMSSGQRLVMTSLNGGRCAAAATDAPWVGIGCLTNRSAVARRVTELLDAGVSGRCTVVACAEVWTGFVGAQVGDLGQAGPQPGRPSFEDLLGAGAIVDALGSEFSRSVEADMAVAVFTANAHRVGDVLRQCVSGRELIVRGFADDVDIAARLDANHSVPQRDRNDPQNRFLPSPLAGR